MAKALEAASLSVEVKRLVRLAEKRGGAEGDNVTLAMASAIGDKKRRGRFGLFLALIATAVTAVGLAALIGHDSGTATANSGSISVALPVSHDVVGRGSSGAARGKPDVRAR